MITNLNTNQPLKNHILDKIKIKLTKPLNQDQIDTISAILDQTLHKKHIINASSSIPFFRKFYLGFSFGINQRKRPRYMRVDRRNAISLRRYFYFCLIMSSGIIISSYISLLWIINYF